MTAATTATPRRHETPAAELTRLEEEVANLVNFGSPSTGALRRSLRATVLSERIGALRKEIGTKAEYDRVDEAIMLCVTQLNAALGLNEVPPGERVSFGYIGNIPTGHPAGGPRDDRLHMVFLPHPGRVGGHLDHIGGFATGDLQGAKACLAQLAGALHFARWQAAR